MKQQLMIWPTIVLTALFLPKNTLLSSSAVTLSTTTNNNPTFNSNSLLLNSKPFDYASFSMASRGVLTVISTNLETTQVERIPFRVYLLRNGRVVEKSASDPTCAALEIDVAPVLALAKTDDYLVIEPVRASDVKARRTLKLKPFFNSDLFNIFNFKRNGEGC